jgi:hypothetical protein
VALTFGIIEWLQVEPTATFPWPKLVFLVILPAVILLIEIVILAVEAWRRPRRNTLEERAERDRNLRALRQVAAQALKARFGPLPRKARKRLESIDSVEELGSLLARSGTATAKELDFPELEAAKAEPDLEQPAA